MCAIDTDPIESAEWCVGRLNRGRPTRRSIRGSADYDQPIQSLNVLPVLDNVVPLVWDVSYVPV